MFYVFFSPPFERYFHTHLTDKNVEKRGKYEKYFNSGIIHTTLTAKTEIKASGTTLNLCVRDWNNM